ncbi:unnamed protein product [Effrenium voratum]|nr:unnamed protein product [Effrenium voratum]
MPEMELQQLRALCEACSRRSRRWNPRLGTGSFSFVFRGCTVHGLDEPVAVKVLKNKDMLPGRGRESEFIQGLRHPNLVNVLGIFEGDVHYVILELCEGGSLQDVIHRDGSLWPTVPLAHRLRAGYDIAAALDFLHQQETSCTGT